MKLFNSKDEPLILTKDQWRKIFLVTSLITLALYVVAMFFSLNGSDIFIVKYQNDQMDRIEAFMRGHGLMGFITAIFLTLEFSIVISFVMQKRTSIISPLIFYVILVIPALFFDLPDIYYTLLPFAFYLVIPIIKQIKDNHESPYRPKFSWKLYGFQLLRLLVASGVTFLLQVMLYVIKAGYFSTDNHVLTFSGYFIYSLEYDIALFVILVTISLYISKGKGACKLWTKSQDHGGSSQTTKTKSQKSLRKKKLSKKQKNKLFWFWTRLYVVQIVGFSCLMILPFVMGKVFEFMVMYFAFAIARYILGFKYSLHFKSEATCLFTGVVIFGLISLAVPFFYLGVIFAILFGTGLAVFLHLSYKYRGWWLFAKIAKPDKFALLYVYFDQNLEHYHVESICKYKGLDDLHTSIVCDFTEGDKISYIAFRHNYSQRMIIYILDEAIAQLTQQN